MLFSPQILVRQQPVLVSVVATTAFDPSGKTAQITLTGSNLIASTGGGASGNNHVRTVGNALTGKKKCEFTATTLVTAGSMAVALVSDVFVITSTPAYLGGDVAKNSFAYYGDGTILKANASVATIGAYTAGDVITMEADIDAGTVKFAVNGGALSSALDFSDVKIGAAGIYPAVEIGDASQAFTGNFGGSAYTRAPTSLYLNW